METPNYNRKATLTTTDHFATDSSVVWMKADVAVALPSIEWHLTPY